MRGRGRGWEATGNISRSKETKHIHAHNVAVLQCCNAIVGGIYGNSIIRLMFNTHRNGPSGPDKVVGA